MQSRLEAEGKILPHIKYNQEGYNMNEFLPKELKDYIAQNQDTLVKLLEPYAASRPHPIMRSFGRSLSGTGLKKRAAKALTSTAP